MEDKTSQNNNKKKTEKEIFRLKKNKIIEKKKDLKCLDACLIIQGRKSQKVVSLHLDVSFSVGDFFDPTD